MADDQFLPKLPVIDFSMENLKSGTSSWFSKCNNVKSAFEEYGCFVAVYDKVSLELHNSMFGTLEGLFDLPKDTKIRNAYDKPYFGYVREEPSKIVPESMGIDDATTLEGTQYFSNLMWPSGNHHFSETVLSYSRHVSELEQMVKRMVFQSYGVEKYYDSHMESTNYLLRLIKYIEPETNEKKLGCQIHTDKSFITILHQNEVNGLEIGTKDGQWIRFGPSPSSFVVIAGDALLAWINGRIHSPNHRVVMQGTKARYSIGLFSFHRGTIQIPEELVDDKHPLQFKPFDHFGLTNYFYYGYESGKTDLAVEAYCGV